MAVANKIKGKDGNNIREITRMYYKNSNLSEIKLIKSVWQVKNGNPILIWPKEYDATLSVTPSYSGNIDAIPASGGTITLTGRLTLYYPNTNIVVPNYNNIVVTPDTNNGLLELNYKNPNNPGYNVISNSSDKTHIYVPNRERNGLTASSGSIDPVSNSLYNTDGYGTYEVSASISGTVSSGGNYSAVINGQYIGKQVANVCTQGNTTYSDLELTYGNPSGNNAYGDYNDSDHPASYQSGTVINPVIDALESTQYSFTSGSTYTRQQGNSDGYNFTGTIRTSGASSGISLASDGTVTLSENTNTNSRSAVIRAAIGNRTVSYTIYQAGKPSS